MVDILFCFQHRKITRTLLGFMSDFGLVIEVGSGAKSRRKLFEKAEFLSVGFGSSDLLQDVRYLGLRGESVDFLLTENVLEHVFDVKEAIREIHRVLRTGGHFFMVTPFFFPLHDIPYDYFRYTAHALRLLLKDYSKVSIHPVLLFPFMTRFVLYYVCLAEK